MEEQGKVLHIVMFPWLAMGHLIPFFKLSNHLAQKGHKVSFVSTPRNLQRLPKIPTNDLSSFINLVSLPLPQIEPLPEYADSSTDIHPKQSQFLKKAFDMLQPPFTTFLDNTRPDWIIYDYASHWLPSIAAKLGISRAFFSLFNAAFMALIGPPSALLRIGEYSISAAENFTSVPKWIPFESNVKYHLYEITKILGYAGGNESGTTDSVRFGISIRDSDIVVIRSCFEFEPECLNLLNDLYKKPILPIGLLSPLVEEGAKENGENWCSIKEWLDSQSLNSVVYVALGTESVLSREELNELALGLEQSELPFFWVLRKPPWLTHAELLDVLPDGFRERVKGRGMLYVRWAPQIKILSHDSVGGFLTHCGWNSVIEGLGFGRVLILFPVLNDQGPNSRLLEGKKLGVEVQWNERNGSFSRDSVAKSLRLAMVGKEGESLRANAKKMKDLFGNRNRNDHYIDNFIHYLEENRFGETK